MNHLEVQLIGVFDNEGKTEGFCYSVDAPRNLWIGALCADGSRMGHHFMAFVLNDLIESDCFNPGQSVTVFDEHGARMVATVLEPVPKGDVGAWMSETWNVLPVSVEVFGGDDAG